MGELNVLRDNGLPGEAPTLELARSNKDTLDHILIQLLIMNKHLALMTGEQITEDDIEEHDE